MHKVDISNFKKILGPSPLGTAQVPEYEFEELNGSLKKLKERNEGLLKEVSGEEYLGYFKEYITEYAKGEISTGWASSGLIPFPTSATPWFLPTKSEVAETDIDKLLDELIQKNQMIQMLSTSLRVSDKIFAHLLNKLSVGFVLFFLLTVFICYLAFS